MAFADTYKNRVGEEAEPTTDDLNPFVEIRKEEVIQALLWLCEHNPSLTKTDVFRLFLNLR
jgi:hypothetical protein